MKRTARWITEYLAPPLVLLWIVVVVWDRVVARYDIPVYLVPRPGRVLSAAASNAGELAGATLLTAEAALCGLAASTAVGTLVALIFSQSRVVARSIYPYAIFLQTVPVVAIAPLVILWNGPRFSSVVIISFILSLFPIITNATTGLTTVSPNLLELFAMHNASRWQVLWKLRMPGAVPYLVTGVQISCGLSVIGAIVGEFFVGYGKDSFGLGYLITQNTTNFKTDYLFAAVLCSTLLGVLIFAAVTLVGMLVLTRWHMETTREDAPPGS